jgi:hypothetical protein
MVAFSCTYDYSFVACTAFRHACEAEIRAVFLMYARANIVQWLLALIFHSERGIAIGADELGMCTSHKCGTVDWYNSIGVQVRW